MPRDTFAELPDDALLRAYAAGDGQAARALTARHLPRVLTHARRLLGEQAKAEAEDVAQEAMLRLWRMAPDWRPGEAKLSTWLYRVVANLCTDRLRRARALPLEAVPEPLDKGPEAARALQDAARVDALQGALMRLPGRQREAVVLRHIEGLGNDEIAAIMGVSVEAVESLTARGKRALAAQLVGQRDELGYEDERD